MRHFRIWGLAAMLIAAFGLPYVFPSERGETPREQAFVAHALMASGQLLSNPVESLLTRQDLLRSRGGWR